MKKRLLATLLTVCMALTMLPAFSITAYASGEKPRVTGSASDPLSGYYVVYEHNGHSYRSDEMGSAFNRNMWRLLDDTERKKVVSALSYRSQRVAQFGPDGNDLIMAWYQESNEWSQAKRLWEQKLSGKHFPQLESFYSGSLSAYYDCYNENPTYYTGSDKALYDAFYEKRAEMNDYWNIGNTAYGVLGRLKGKQVAVAVNFGSKEIIKMLSDTYFMPAATRGAKPLSDALGQALGIAADQGMGMLSAPPSPGEQIAKIETMLSECKTTAETVMNEKLPAAAEELSDLLRQIRESEEQREAEYITQNQQQIQDSQDRQEQTEEIIETAYEAAEAAVNQELSLTSLTSQWVPTKGDVGADEDDYINYRNGFMNGVASLMGQIRTEFETLSSDYETVRAEYAEYKEAVLDEAQLETLPGSAFELYAHIQSRQDRFMHSVAGMPDMYRKMVEVKPEDAYSDFSADLFIYYGYAESVPYFSIVRDRFFDEDDTEYDDLIEEYQDFARVLQSVLENEEAFFVALSDIHGRMVALHSKIEALENLYQIRTNQSNYLWHSVPSVASVGEFFAPLYPAESNVYPSSDIGAFMLSCKNEFRLYFKTEQGCQNRITEFTQSKADLAVVKADYLATLENYLDVIEELGAEHAIVAANYENAISQAYSSVKGIREVENEYIGSIYSSSYTYDGKFMNNAFVYPVMNMRKIQDDMMSAANKEAERQRILTSLKAMKTQEDTHLRRFETAKAHQEHYEGELRRLSAALGLDSTGQKASVLYALSKPNMETAHEILYRLFPDYRDRDIVTNYSVENVNGSNLNHAIEMLEGKTENYYRLQHYKDKLGDQQASPSGAALLSRTGGINENVAKSVYIAAQTIYQNGRTSTITYAQEVIQAEYFTLIDTLEQSGVDYTGEYAPVVRIANVGHSNGVISATIENESGRSIENTAVILEEYRSDDSLIGASEHKVTKLDNLYSETKSFSAHEETVRFNLRLLPMPEIRMGADAGTVTVTAPLAFYDNGSEELLCILALYHNGRMLGLDTCHVILESASGDYLFSLTCQLPVGASGDDFIAKVFGIEPNTYAPRFEAISNE